MTVNGIVFTALKKEKEKPFKLIGIVVVYMKVCLEAEHDSEVSAKRRAIGFYRKNVGRR